MQARGLVGPAGSLSAVPPLFPWWFGLPEADPEVGAGEPAGGCAGSEHSQLAPTVGTWGSAARGLRETAWGTRRACVHS